MKGVCAAFGSNVDYSATGVGVLRTEIAGLNAEFPDFLYLRTILRTIKGQIGIIATIQHELALVGPGPIDGEELIMTLQNRIYSCGSRGTHSRHKRHQRI